MEHGLSCGCINIDADIIAIRMELFLNLLFDEREHIIHRFAFLVSQIEIRRDVACWDDERVSWRNRIAIIERYAQIGLADDAYATRQIAEWARAFLSTREFVEMDELIEFVGLIMYQTLKRQNYVALVGVLFMDGMQAETFLFQVASHRIISHSVWFEQIAHHHHHIRLRVGFEHIEHIDADDRVELAFGELGAIIVIVAFNVIALPFQFVGIEAEATTEIKDSAFEQIVL